MAKERRRKNIRPEIIEFFCGTIKGPGITNPRTGISNQPEAAPSAPLLERGQVAGSIMHANELQDCMKIFLVNQ